MVKVNYAQAYTQLHEVSDSIFGGSSVLSHVPSIGELVNQIRIKKKPVRLLDYGCGKGLQYSKHHSHVQWQTDIPFLYDIGVPAFSKKPPKASFDGIICTDMMEHIASKDIDGILEDIFSCLDPKALKTFVFFSICCRPAKKKFPNGRNLHLTIEGPEWWHDRITAFKIPNGRVIVRYS